MKEETLKFHSASHLLTKQLVAAVCKYRLQNDKEYNLSELIDSAYAIREVLAFVNDIRKELEKEERMVHAKAGMICIAADEDGLKLQTWYCSAEITSQIIPKLPKVSTHGEAFYSKFMGYFGIKQKFIDQDIFRLHFPNFMTWYNDKWLAKGKPELPGINPKDSNPIYKLTIRKKKDIGFK